jgi:prevent-host-death family protein
MNVSLTHAKAQLTELVRRAEAGEEVVLTRHGRPVAKLVQTVRPPLTPEDRLRIIDEIVESARGKATPGPCAARAADFLYDDDGLPA